MQVRSKAVWILLLAGSWMCVSRASAAPANAAPSDPLVVMISVDGLAGFYLDDPKAEMPNIRALAAEGARSALMKASTPSVTWPNHTTLVTGVNPAKHGVVGNNYWDRAAGKKIALIGDPIYDKEQIVKTPTIYDLAKEKGLLTAAIRWPGTRNAKTLDWAIPAMKTAAAAATNSTRALLAECEQAGIHLVPDYETHGDEYCTRVFLHLLRAHRPGLALLHIGHTDHVQHLNGPRTPEAYAAVKAADQQVGAVWAAMKRDFPGKATLFVVSDHGFSEIKETILPLVVLRGAGISSAAAKQPRAAVHVLTQGGAAMLYVRDASQRDEVLAKVRQAFTGVRGIGGIVGTEQFKDYGVADPKVDPHAPDLILFAQDGFTFGNTADGDVPFLNKTERSGTHGHDPNLPNLHALFVATGAGIRKGVKLNEISNTSVAPTIARLLHLTIPNADGEVLTTVLAE